MFFRFTQNLEYGVLKRFNTKAKTDNNTGFGSDSSNYGGCFLTKNGNANIYKDGIGFFESINW